MHGSQILVVNDWLCQFLANILDINVQRPKTMETTALGAAYLAGLQAGIYSDVQALSKINQIEKQFTANVEPLLRATLLKGWANAIKCTLEQQS